MSQGCVPQPLRSSDMRCQDESSVRGERRRSSQRLFELRSCQVQVHPPLPRDSRPYFPLCRRGTLSSHNRTPLNALFCEVLRAIAVLFFLHSLCRQSQLICPCRHFCGGIHHRGIHHISTWSSPPLHDLRLSLITFTLHPSSFTLFFRKARSIYCCRSRCDNSRQITTTHDISRQLTTAHDISRQLWPIPRPCDFRFSNIAIPATPAASVGTSTKNLQTPQRWRRPGYYLLLSWV